MPAPLEHRQSIGRSIYKSENRFLALDRFREVYKEKPFGVIMATVIVPLLDTPIRLSTSDHPPIRRSDSHGCQSPCGNLWLAAIAFMFEDLTEWKKKLKENGPPRNGKATVTTKSRVLLSKVAAKALVCAFLDHVTLDGSSRVSVEQELVEKIVEKDITVEIVWCRLFDIPGSVLQWLYALEVLECDEENHILQRWFDTDLLLRTISDINLGTITLGSSMDTFSGSERDPPSSESDTTTILTLSTTPIAGMTNTFGKFKFGKTYEKVIGLVHTSDKEVLEGASVFGTRTAWIGRQEPEAVFVTDFAGTGRWWRASVTDGDQYSTIKGKPRDAFARLISGSTNSERMAITLGDSNMNKDLPRTNQANYEGVSGYFVSGRMIDQQHVAVGYSFYERKGETEPFRRVVVGDPSAAPSILSKKKFKRPIGGIHYTPMQLLGQLSNYLMLATFWSVFGTTLDHHHNDGNGGKYRVNLKDALIWMAGARLLVDNLARIYIGYRTLWVRNNQFCRGLLQCFCCIGSPRSEATVEQCPDSSQPGPIRSICHTFCKRMCFRTDVQEAQKSSWWDGVRQNAQPLGRPLSHLFFLRSIEHIMRGIPWEPRKVKELGRRTSYWARRLPLTTRAIFNIVIIVWTIASLLIDKAGDCKVESTFMLLIITLAIGAPTAFREGGLGTVLDEVSGVQLTSLDMIRFLASCSLIEILASATAIAVAGDLNAFSKPCNLGNTTDIGNSTDGVAQPNECPNSEKALIGIFIVAVVLESITYASCLLQSRAVLSTGFREELRAREDIASGSPLRFLSLNTRMRTVGEDWGLGGVANRPGFRGVLTLLEGSEERPSIQANCPFLQFADWVSLTRANGFKLFPVLRGDSYTYCARDFDPFPDEPEKSKQESLIEVTQKVDSDSYAMLKLLYTDMRIPWTGSAFKMLSVPGLKAEHSESSLSVEETDFYVGVTPGNTESLVLYACIPRYARPMQLALVLPEETIIPLYEPKKDIDMPSFQPKATDSDDFIQAAAVHHSIDNISV